MSFASYLVSSCSKPSLFLILFLCLSVMGQMLGAPITLLNPSTDADVLGASVLEGFSVPPCLTCLEFVTTAVANCDIPPIVNRPVLVYSLFHPPLL